MNRIAMVARSPAVWMISFGLLGFAAGALVPACQSSTVNCTTGTSRCGAGCADFRSDSLNCGACGVACQSLQICQDSTCQCRPGSVLCGGSCVVTTSDQNCGACGRSCQLPDGGPAVCTPNPDGGLPECLAQCTPDLTNCAGGCVNLQSDLFNCGQCGKLCLDGQSCRAGSCTSDVIAACINTASIVGIQAIADVAGRSRPFGNAPQALASLRGVLLEGDGIDLKLEQMRLEDFGVLTNVNDAGVSPNHIFVDDPYIYLVNGDAFADAGGAPNSTLQVLQQMAGDAGLGDAGLPLSAIATVNFDAGNPPQAVTKLGNNLYIALFLGEVAEVDVSNPAAPRTTRTFDLRT
ncbi:MAG TPA: MXAN_6577-like cysteine-rich protein, partial [Myxococcaceae bacterium]|nr:MXAN_6577-like cysteine-rich protein [Myxococcaceae bacterium]